MSVSINEMTVTVPGNVVKNMTEDGKSSLLRMTQDQAQSLWDQLGPVLGFFKAQASGDSFGDILAGLKTFPITGITGSLANVTGEVKDPEPEVPLDIARPPAPNTKTPAG